MNYEMGVNRPFVRIVSELLVDSTHAKCDGCLA